MISIGMCRAHKSNDVNVHSQKSKIENTSMKWNIHNSLNVTNRVYSSWDLNDLLMYRCRHLPKTQTFSNASKFGNLQPSRVEWVFIEMDSTSNQFESYFNNQHKNCPRTKVRTENDPEKKINSLYLFVHNLTIIPPSIINIKILSTLLCFTAMAGAKIAAC